MNIYKLALIALIFCASFVLANDKFKFIVEDVTLSEAWGLVGKACEAESGNHRLRYPEKRISVSTLEASCGEIVAMLIKLDTGE